MKTAIVIGAGIAGLATARALAVRGFKVTVLERNARAIGASIRNFGMIWPIGQPDGELYDAAMTSKRLWKQICDEAGIWYEESGSLHLAHSTEALHVLEELAEIYQHRDYQLLDANETIRRSPFAVKEKLLGSLYSNQELIVDPRTAIPMVASWLLEKFGVEFFWNKTVTDICYPIVFAGNGTFEADEIYVCNGSDFETLYPEVFASLALTKCKLQMMRMQQQSKRIGPALCGALSLAHYKSFRSAPSLLDLRERFEEQFPGYSQWGIHVMVSQTQSGELTIGDSHEYGSTHDPFDKHLINQMILDYLSTFARFEKDTIIETWNGTYAKLIDDSNYLLSEPESGVTIINGFGGAGMTLGFGICEHFFTTRKVMTANA